MNRDDIIRMAREVGIELTINQHGNTQFRCFSRELERFFNMAQAAEREACAKVCEEPGWNAANWCATQIRARGQA